MLKLTDQYFWNFVFLVFFTALVIMAVIILETESRIILTELGWLDGVLITLATWRLTRFIAEDSTTKLFREQFYDLKKTARALTLERPVTGPRRTIIDIITSSWSLGLGVGAAVAFVYLLTPYSVYPLVFLALSAAVSFLDSVYRKLQPEA